MEYTTLGMKYNAGKVAYIKCIANDSYEDLDIKDRAFLLVVVKKGRVTFKIGGREYGAFAPCFICFDESENPEIKTHGKTECFSIYFHPMFLNVNMTFSLLRCNFYGDIAHNHDLFLLKPFTDKNYIIPILGEHTERVERLCFNIKRELEEQRDWYWSCRGRSYFMELIITLERFYGIIGRGEAVPLQDSIASITDEKLKNAVIYIENRFAQNINLDDIIKACGINHTKLSELFKKETGKTPIEYLRGYRVSVAKKLLEFTELPVKEIADRCGFKTVQHFTRVFGKALGKTPAVFRKDAVQKRKDEIR